MAEDEKKEIEKPISADDIIVRDEPKRDKLPNLPPPEIPANKTKTQYYVEQFKNAHVELPKKIVLLSKETRDKKIGSITYPVDYYTFVVADGRHGINIFEIEQPKDDVPVITNEKLIANIDLKNIYRVKLEGVDNNKEIAIHQIEFKNSNHEDISLVGDNDILLSMLTKASDLDDRHSNLIIKLLNEQPNVDAEKKMYYSPGVWWLPEKKRIILAKDAGYNPPWKEHLKWEPSSLETVLLVNPEDKKKALEITRQFVESYGSPEKVSAVLSYAILAPLAFLLKSRLSYFPHLVLQGLQNLGKSALLEWLKLFYKASWSDPTPKSEYQARRLLAQIAIPALIDEMRSIFAIINNKESDALEIVHTSATVNMLRHAGTATYGGIFLAIRPIIGATNADLSLVPYQADKLIVMKISDEDKLDDKKGKGYTPRTMPTDVKKVIPMLFVEMMEDILSKELENIMIELNGMNRDELKDAIIEQGYKIWQKIYQRYGVEIFPKPYKVNNPDNSVDNSQDYLTQFMTYVANKIPNSERVGAMGATTTDAVRVYFEDFEKKGAIIVRDIDRSSDKKMIYQLICTSSFLTHFSQIASRDNRLPYLGWETLTKVMKGKATSVNTPRRNGQRVAVFEIIEELTEEKNSSK